MRDTETGRSKLFSFGSLRKLPTGKRGSKSQNADENDVASPQQQSANDLQKSNSNLESQNRLSQSGASQSGLSPWNEQPESQQPQQSQKQSSTTNAASASSAAPAGKTKTGFFSQGFLRRDSERDVGLDNDEDTATALSTGSGSNEQQAKKLVVHPTPRNLPGKGPLNASQNLSNANTSQASAAMAGQIGQQTARGQQTQPQARPGTQQPQTGIDKEASGAATDANQKPVGRLVYVTSYGGKMNFPLVKEETTIGRKEDNQIVLTDPKISKCHASVHQTSHGYSILDRNSSNGVKVNNEFIPPGKQRPLVNGDEVMIGGIKLVFYDQLDPNQGNGTTGVSGTSSFGGSGGSGAGSGTGSGGHVDDRILKLVTILPSENQYDRQIAIKAELDAEAETDFRCADEVESINVLKEDYEKLRLAYQLSKITLTNDITPHLEKSMELMFEIVPVDRGVILLVDQNTGTLAAHYVKLREGAEEEGKEILLSSTILKKVYESRKCLITTDASQDSTLAAAASVMNGQIRSVICVPLMAHNKVHGILHLDSSDRITRFSNKDLALVQAISNQTAIAIENSVLMSEFEANARLNEQLSRFLAPHVVQKMSDRSAMIRRGGRQLVGTIIFCDIRGFTNFSEKSEPVEVVHLLNDYFERLVRIVFKYNGVVDKYIGDALMAVFGTLEEDHDAEFRAVAAALEFQLAIKDMNEERQRVGKEPISIGVGVNTGELLVGFIGSSQRLEYTCIGDTVNTSSRVCSMSKKDQVLISEFTYKYVSDRVSAVSVGYRQFKGKLKEVQVYEVFGTKEPGDPVKIPENYVPPPLPPVQTSILPETTQSLASSTPIRRASINLKESPGLQRQGTQQDIMGAVQNDH